MITDSRDIIRCLERDGFVRVSVRGSHHKFAHRETGRVVMVVHPKRDIPPGTVNAIYKQAGWPKD